MAVSFVYPPSGNFSYLNGGHAINFFDTLYVEYNSTFSALNLTLFCTQSATDDNFYFVNAASNPILASGTYNWGSIDSYNFQIAQFPTTCHFKLTEYGNNDDSLNGEVFAVTSQAGVSTTYEPSAARTSAPIPSAAASATSSATHTTFPTPTPTPASAVSDSSDGSTGLSTGAKAGIGVGVASAAVIILALVAFFLIRTRQKRHSRQESYNTTEKPYGATMETGDSTYGSHTAYKKGFAPIEQQPDPHEMDAPLQRAELYDMHDAAANSHELHSSPSVGERHELPSERR